MREPKKRLILTAGSTPAPSKFVPNHPIRDVRAGEASLILNILGHGYF